MQLQGEIPSGTWSFELPSCRAILKSWREKVNVRKIAIALAVTLLACTTVVELSAYAWQRHRERVLREDLALLRSTIADYSRIEHHAPHRLDDLVRDGYLIELPPDPFTEKVDWDPDFAEVPESIDREHFGIVNVHSRSTQRARNGRAYCEW